MRDGIKRLMDARDNVDEKFLAYAASDIGVSVLDNHQVLANLALIGGRLDRIISRELAKDRQDARRRLLGDPI